MQSSLGSRVAAQVLSLFASVTLGGLGLGGADAAAPESGRLTLLLKGEQIFIRSSFSPEHDLLITLGKGANRQVDFQTTRLVSKADSLQALVSRPREGVIHHSGDDATPWHLNGTYIGGNHGSATVLEVLSFGHSLGESDLGGLWVDEAGAEFVLMRIERGDKLWFHAQNRGSEARWSFNTRLTGTSLRQGERRLAIASSSVTQLRPALRIKSMAILVDGSIPLRDGEVMEGDFLEVREDSEVVNPAAVVDLVIRNQGKASDFVAPELPGVLKNQLLYRFYPNGANIVESQATALVPFQLGSAGFIQTQPLVRGGFDTHQYYIPKTLPFTLQERRYDFEQIEDFSLPVPAPINFGVEHHNVANAGDLPDRFIQFLGLREGGFRKVGYAVGYSRLDGLTQPAIRAAGTRLAAFIHTTKKTYPRAIEGGAVSAGTEYRCVAYRQYFAPALQPNATALYWHPAGEGYLLYLDYHQAVTEEVLQLPELFTHKKVTILEKTESMKVHGDAVGPNDGLKISVSGSYGRAVLFIQ